MRTPLAVTRQMVATIASALAAVVVVAVVLFPPGTPAEDPDATLLAAALLAVGAAAGVGGVVWSRRRPLPCEEDALRSAYVTQVLLGAAFAEVPALVGFVATVLVGAPWWAVAGAVLAAVLLWLVAPTRRELARRDAALAATGCGASLSAALQPPASPPTKM